MNFAEAAAFGLIACLLIANVWASVRVLRSSALERHQKLIQLVMIWFIPILGAVCGFYFSKNEYTPPQARNTYGYGHDPDTLRELNRTGRSKEIEAD